MNTLASFIPFNFARNFLLNPGQHPLNLQERFEVAGFFADISGFTPISEALSRYGKSGTEELNRLLNHYFSQMLGLIQAYGGVVAGFGGDSLTVLFPYQPDPAQGLQLAIGCALEMQAQMAQYHDIPTVAGEFSLAIKVGLGLGPVLCASVGDNSSQLEYVVAGSLLEQAAAAEHMARRGEVVIATELLKYAGKVECAPVNASFCRIINLNPKPPKIGLPNLPASVPAELLPHLEAYLHPSIAYRVETGQASLIAEHRKVTILFVDFAEFDYDNDPQVVGQLQNYLGQVIQLIQKYGGYLHQVETGDKGSKYIVFFGAPLAHENDEERALRCALELRFLAEQLGIATRTGINSGKVYLGLIGAEKRAEYTAIGHAANLAARLMQSAQGGQILVSEATRRALKSKFRWEELAPIRVKGQTDPVEVAALAGLNLAEKPERHSRSHPAEAELAMVGREAELKEITGLIEQVLAGRGQIAGITGEAGLGKSRLVAEVVKLARGRGMPCYSGQCFSYATNVPYAVWQPILRSLFGLDTTTGIAEQLRQLERGLEAINPAYLERLPLLEGLLGLPMEETAFSRSINDPKITKTLRENLVVDCLQALSTRGTTTDEPLQPPTPRPRPLLLVLEDCHWLDPLSHDLLEAVGRGIAESRVLLLAVYRPPELERVKVARVMSLPYATEIRLTPLTAQKAEQLVELKLTQRFGQRLETARYLAGKLNARADGNPFYLEELVNLLYDRKLEVNDRRVVEGLEWPESLQSLILSRLDRLEEEEKTVLKVASVVGRSFKAEWLWGAYPQVGRPEQVKTDLEILSRLSFTSLEKPEPDMEYIFRHILTREAVYESLALATRSELHGLVGDYIEHRYAERLEQYVDLLAYHYSQTPNRAKQREYYRRAAKAARTAYANDAALEYYRKLLPLVAEAEERAEILLEMAQIERITGEWENGEKQLEQALIISQRSGNIIRQARCLRVLGLIKADRSDYDVSLKFSQESLQLFQQIADKQGVAQVLNDLADVAKNRGDYEAARSYSQESLALYRELDDKLGITATLNILGLVAEALGQQAEARNYLEESLQVARQTGNKLVLGEALNSLAVFTFYQGDYEADRRYVQESLELFQEIGYKHKVAQVLSNMGAPAFESGDYEAARGFWLKGLALFRELGDKRQVGRMLNNLAKACERQQDYSQVRSYYQESLALRREVGDREGIAQSLNNLGMLARLQADYPSAHIYLEQGLQLAREIGHKGQILLSLYNLSYLALLEQNHPEAINLLAQSLALAQETGNKSWIIDNLSLLVCVLASRPESAICAIQIAGAVEGLIGDSGYEREPLLYRLYERKLAELRDKLGEIIFTQACLEGQTTDLEQLLNLALLN